jgi:hypothetical protein
MINLTIEMVVDPNDEYRTFLENYNGPIPTTIRIGRHFIYKSFYRYFFIDLHLSFKAFLNIFIF